MADCDGVSRPPPGASLVPGLLLLADAAERAGCMDIADWARSEANGYRSDVPPYRRVCGRLQARDPALGWLMLPPGGDAEAAFVAHGLRVGVADLEAALATASGGTATVRLDGAARARIGAAAGSTFTETAALVDVRDLQSLLLSVASLADRWCSQMATRAAMADPAAALNRAAAG